MRDYNYLFDTSLIRNFRDKYLSGHGFVYDFYHNKAHKDLWSKICSSMDWIEVSISKLNNVDSIIKFLVANHGLKNSVELFDLISSIATLNNSIKDIWTAVSVGSGKYFYPFKNDHHIFNGKVVKKVFTKCDLIHHSVYRLASDDDYFSNIRAFFGVHSSNGNVKTYVDTNFHKHYIRFFSSWSSHCFYGSNYNVIMYCNNNSLSKYFNFSLRINIFDLIRFAYIRYKSLNLLSCFIDKFHNNVVNKMWSGVLKYFKFYQMNHDSLHQLLVLNKFTNRAHMMEDYYFDEINDYIDILKIYRYDKHLKNFANSDRSKIKSYIHLIKTHVIKDYFKSLKDRTCYKSKYLDSVYSIRSRWLYDDRYKPYYSQFLRSINHIKYYHYDYKLYGDSLDELISKGLFSKYVQRFSPLEVYLSLIAKTYFNDPEIINKNYHIINRRVMNKRSKKAYSLIDKLQSHFTKHK